MKHHDYIIIGGGIVGLSVAWALMNKHPLARVAVLEKESDIAQHQSGRNSGVMHSGIYYKPGSLKATLCREGNRRLREFCDEHGVQYEICGKLIVATRREELPGLNRLHELGVRNGVRVKRLHPGDVSELEPHVECLEGLHVPATGIVNYSAVCAKLTERIQKHDGLVETGAEVTETVRVGEKIVLRTSSGEFEAAWIVNCAGLHSDRVAKMAGAKPTSRIIPFRGEYYELKPERRELVRGLIYPVADPRFPFLGVHFTRMIDGAVHAGPNAVLSGNREGYSRTDFKWRDVIDTVSYPGFWRMAGRYSRMACAEMYRSCNKRAFVRELQRLVPAVQEEDLVPARAGVRAQAVRRDGSLVDDFMIITDGRATHVCNAPSPAATSSLEIGRMIADQVPDVVPVRLASCAI